MTPTYAQPWRVPAPLPDLARPAPATHATAGEPARPVILCRLAGRVLVRETPTAAAEWAKGPRAALLLSRARQGKGV